MNVIIVSNLRVKKQSIYVELVLFVHALIYYPRFRDIDFNPDGSQFASCSFDRRVKVCHWGNRAMECY